MSSNQYGFTCNFELNGKTFFCQIVYVDTREDDPVALAQFELKHRDWQKSHQTGERIGLAGFIPLWGCALPYAH